MSDRTGYWRKFVLAGNLVKGLVRITAEPEIAKTSLHVPTIEAVHQVWIIDTARLNHFGHSNHPYFFHAGHIEYSGDPPRKPRTGTAVRKTYQNEGIDASQPAGPEAVSVS
jgi:hypothetical protein